MSKKILALVLSLMVLVVFTPCIAFANDGGEYESSNIYIAKEGKGKAVYVDQWDTRKSIVEADTGETFDLHVYNDNGEKVTIDLIWEYEGYDSYGEDECNADITEEGKVTTGESAGILYAHVNNKLASDDELDASVEVYIGGAKKTVITSTKGKVYFNDIEIKSGKNIKYKVMELPSKELDKSVIICEADNEAIVDASCDDGILTVRGSKTGKAGIDLYYDEEEDPFYYQQFIVNGTMKWYEGKYDAILYTNKTAEIVWVEPKAKVTIPSKLSKKYKVTAISAMVANGEDAGIINDVYIPKTVTKIGRYAFGYYWNSDGKWTKAKITVHAPKNSAGHKFAKKYKFTWKSK